MSGCSTGRGRSGRRDRPASMTGPVTQGARARVEARVRGRVQGVGFRVFALREGTRLDLDGFVANEIDGSVRVVAEGDRARLEQLLARLEEGPPAAIVDGVITRWEPARGMPLGFRIESGAHRGD
jgi:acylphosphatase